MVEKPIGVLVEVHAPRAWPKTTAKAVKRLTAIPQSVIVELDATAETVPGLPAPQNVGKWLLTGAKFVCRRKHGSSGYLVIERLI